MTRSEHNPWLSRYAGFLALNTLVLIGIGGLVTSKGVGMSVPDWPTTYGYNMFFFPISLWRGGIFYEHTHRLVGSWVGLLTLGLTVWLWLKESRAWMKRLGVVALILVSLQGLLGGLRVTLYRDEIGIVHAALAQVFLGLTVAITLFTTQAWKTLAPTGLSPRVRSVLLLLTGLIFLQLLLGATLRHEHAGLAIPDFPLAYGKLWPDTDPVTLERINATRGDVGVTAFQIRVHMAHRVGALVLLATGLYVAWQVLRLTKPASLLAKGVVGWQALLWCQGLLGAATVWTGKSADIATFHVVLGAVSLVTGVALVLVATRLSQSAPVRLSTPVHDREPSPTAGSPTLTSV